LVRKQRVNQNEGIQKQLEAVNKEAAVNQQPEAREITRKMEEMKRALLASQQRVDDLTVEMAQLRVEFQKHLEVYICAILKKIK
jgi:hypothetical protein